MSRTLKKNVYLVIFLLISDDIVLVAGNMVDPTKLLIKIQNYQMSVRLALCKSVCLCAASDTARDNVTLPIKTQFSLYGFCQQKFRGFSI